MSLLRRFRLSLLPIVALSGLAIATAVSVGCSDGTKEDQGLSEDRITGTNAYGNYGYYGEYYGYYGNDYGYYGYGYEH